jgi:hypothetical protein
VKTIETHQIRIEERLDLQSAAELSKEASLWIEVAANRRESSVRRSI